MIKTLRGFVQAMAGALALSAAAAAQALPPDQQPVSNPVCVRLEGQLAVFDRSAADASRADEIRRAEDAVARQQADLDRTIAQAHRVGCEGQGFLSLFSGFSPQCGPLVSQIQDMRGNLDRMMSNLEQLKSGGSDQEGQRRALIGQLAQNNCGPQYTAAASAAGPQGFFDALFGGGTIVNPNGDGAPSGTFQTVCVRTCDGYYFPISYSTVPSRFVDDQRTCQRLCPAAEVSLYSYHNPGEDMAQAVSADGQQLYTALPNAFRYRKELVSGCSCRRPGQSWADALKNADDSSTLESGDIVVTDAKAKALSQAGKPGKGVPSAPVATAAPADTSAGAGTAAESDAHRKVRVVGPPFLSGQ